MSNSGKVYIILSIIFSLVAITFGVLVALDKSQYVDQLTAVERTLNASPDPITYSFNPLNPVFKTNINEPAATLARLNASFQTTKDELAETIAQLTDTRERLARSEAENQRLTTELASTKRDLETRTTELAQSRETLAGVQGELDEMKRQLGGRPLETVLANLTKAQEDLQILSAEKKIIEDTMARLQIDLRRLQELDRLRDQRIAPMELSGKVLAINKDWNFVVLDVGKDNRLVEGIDLTVYRGDTLIGKVRTVSVDAGTAVADILPDWTKTEIQVGDRVLF